MASVAGSLLGQIAEQDRARAPEAIAKTQQQLDAIAVAWPSLVPPERIDTDASLLYGAAARIEIPRSPSNDARALADQP